MNGHRYGSTTRFRREPRVAIEDVPLIDGALRIQLIKRVEQARAALIQMNAAALRSADLFSDDHAAYEQAAETLAVLLDATAYRLTQEPRRPVDDEDWEAPF